MKNENTRTARSAFTLVELLVVIAIIAILVTLLLPAINAARESARRTGCLNNFSQVTVAIGTYVNAHETLPTGVKAANGPIVNSPNGMHHNWIVQLLPYLEENNLDKAIDRSASVYAGANRAARDITLATLSCPSSGAAPTFGVTHIAGVHHDVEAPIDATNNGVFFLNSELTYDDILDGAGYTLFVGEKTIDMGDDLGWLSGTRSSLRNTGTPINSTSQFASTAGPAAASGVTVNSDIRGETLDARAEKERDPDKKAQLQQQAAAAIKGLYVGGFGSNHPRGAHFAFGDGRVSFLVDQIDFNLYQKLGHRADGQLVDLKKMQ